MIKFIKKNGCVTGPNIGNRISRAKVSIRSAFLYLPKAIKRIVHIFSMRALYKKGREVNESYGITLFWVPGGMSLMLHLEAAIAAALKLRGNRVHAVICDGVFRACSKREIIDQVPIHEWNKSCNACQRACVAVLKTMGIPYSNIGDYVAHQDLCDLKHVADAATWGNVAGLKYREINVGKNVKASIWRFLKGYNLSNDSTLVQEYAYSGLVCAAAVERAIQKLKPSRIFMSHCGYVDWGPALHTALARKVPVTGWMGSYLPSRFYFCHVGDSVHPDMHKMSSSAWNETLHRVFTGEQSERLDHYLQDRYGKDTSFDIKNFKQYTGRGDELRDRYGLDLSRPVWGVMAHVNWDAVSDRAPMVYESLNQWTIKTFQVIKDITDVQWIIKVHPAEAWSNPESGIWCLIKKYFPDLPEHIRVLPAEENISPLDFFDMVDGGVTVFGTPGLELALHGKPIILAGDAHYGRKGFTYDADSQEHYRKLLKQAGHLSSLSVEQRELASKYAYCYFIQRQIPISVVRDPKSKWWSFQLSKRELLLDGHDPVLDLVCERIMDGKDFIMDENLIRLHGNL